MTSAPRDITDLAASQLADRHLQFFDVGHWTCKSKSLQQAQRSLELALLRRWAKLMPGRCQDLV